MVVIRLSDSVVDLLNRLVTDFERATGRRLSYEELVEMLLSKADLSKLLPDDVWF
ncbi:MAG: hypothetical protein RMH84_03280 [Sulfolobales archaeon]|nr:hypothetical protein [Sulfolobales archaeon]MCX8209309.1 hypothetical protein [Sulfolobales archaeon]MDW8010600.1 hypothetical protein [Sulfolobales archaeon]